MIKGKREWKGMSGKKKIKIGQNKSGMYYGEIRDEWGGIESSTVGKAMVDIMKWLEKDQKIMKITWLKEERMSILEKIDGYMEKKVEMDSKKKKKEKQKNIDGKELPFLFKTEGTINEEVNVENIIKELISTGWSGDNESQMKAVQLLKGLATSDDPASNKFMKALDKFTSGLKPENF